MTTYRIDADKYQKKALNKILKALKIKFEISESILPEILDETEYQLSNKYNKKHLDESIKQIKNGQSKKVDINDLWK